MGVPLLVFCTARTELYELHASWGGGKRNSTTISLSALPPEETAAALGGAKAVRAGGTRRSR